MTSTKPYLLRAIYEWCADQGFTPYIQVVVDARARVPMQYVKDGQIVLNIGPTATQQLLMGNDEITFQARFSGAVFPVSVPVDAVGAIYARENGQGMGFEVETADSSSSSSEAESEAAIQPDDPQGGGAKRPTLTRIK